MFSQDGMDQEISPTSILDALENAQPQLDKDEIVDLFRRLCLTIQLVSDIDANWTESGYHGERSETLPSALFELASSETAFEQTEDGYACTFFARDILEDAFAMLRPN